MAFRIMSPIIKVADKHMRARLDSVRIENRITWNGMQDIAEELTGKRDRLTVSECKRVMDELKRRRK